MSWSCWFEVNEIHEIIRGAIFAEIYRISTKKKTAEEKIKGVLKYIDQQYSVADPLSEGEKRRIRQQKEEIDKMVQVKVKAGIEKGLKELEKKKK